MFLGAKRPLQKTFSLSPSRYVRTVLHVSLRDGVKKMVLLGGAPHKVAYPPPPHLVVVKVPLFLGNFLFA